MDVTYADIYLIIFPQLYRSWNTNTLTILLVSSPMPVEFRAKDSNDLLRCITHPFISPCYCYLAVALWILLSRQNPMNFIISWYVSVIERKVLSETFIKYWNLYLFCIKSIVHSWWTTWYFEYLAIYKGESCSVLVRTSEMKFALDLFGPNAITWKMTMFLNNLITMKIFSVVWILDYPNLLLLNFFGTPYGIGLIEVVLCDSFGMKALKLKWAKIWPFLLTYDSRGKKY